MKALASEYTLTQPNCELRLLNVSLIYIKSYWPGSIDVSKQSNISGLQWHGKQWCECLQRGVLASFQ